MATLLKRSTAFTLAEVLITLAIIGIVATMTIPTLVNNYQKTQYVTGLKKAYTQFNQALIQMAVENGCVGDLACTPSLNANGFTSNKAGDEFVKYIKVVKNCRDAANQGCFANNVSTTSGGTGPRVNYDSWPGYKFITADGASYNFWASPCEDTGVSTTTVGPLTQVCGALYVDVNGLKGPNNFGKDVFQFYITNGKGPMLYPFGGKLSSEYSDCHTNTEDPDASDGCTGRIVEDGWQMNY